jgi:hypothetical protein
VSWWEALLSRGGRVLVVAIAMLPVLLLVILSVPAWVLWPFLSSDRRESVHLMVQQFEKWTRDVLRYTRPSSRTVPTPALTTSPSINAPRQGAGEG